MTISSLDSEPEDVGDDDIIEGVVNAAVVEIIGPLEEGLVIGYAHQPLCVTAYPRELTPVKFGSHAYL